MAENTCGRDLVPAPPDGCFPVPVWVVTTGGDGDRYEVAAAFADGSDARRYAAWWNREETRRYGHLPTHATATAIAEEIDFYPADTWRPPTHLHLANPSGQDVLTRAATGLPIGNALTDPPELDQP